MTSTASSLVLSPPSAATSSAWSKTGGSFDDQSVKNVWGQPPISNVGPGINHGGGSAGPFHPSRQNSFGSSSYSSQRSNYGGGGSQVNSAFSSPYNARPSNLPPHPSPKVPYPSAYHHPSGLHPSAPPFPNPYTNAQQQQQQQQQQHRPPAPSSPAYGHHRTPGSFSARANNMASPLGSPAQGMAPSLNPASQPFASPGSGGTGIPGGRKGLYGNGGGIGVGLGNASGPTNPPGASPSPMMIPPLPVGIPQGGGVWLPVNVAPPPPPSLAPISASHRPGSGFVSPISSAGGPGTSSHHHSPFSNQTLHHPHHPYGLPPHQQLQSQSQPQLGYGQPHLGGGGVGGLGGGAGAGAGGGASGAQHGVFSSNGSRGPLDSRAGTGGGGGAGYSGGYGARRGPW